MAGFRKAERRKAKLRLGLTGPAGSGKTYGALLIAMGLGGKIALIDTENGSGDAPADVNIDTGKFAVSIGIREARQTVADTALNKTFLFHGIQRCARMGLTRNSKQHTRSGQAGYHRLFHNASCVAKFIVIEAF